MSLNPKDDVGDKAAPPPDADRNVPEDPVWDPSLLPGRPPRPAAHVRFELELALAYKERYQRRAADDYVDYWVQMMRDDNDADIARLQAELDRATDQELMTAPAGAARPDEEIVDHDLDVEGGKVVRWPRRQSGHAGPDVGL